MDVIEAIKGRRSINLFDPARTLPDGTLGELLKLAGLTPSSMNLQPWKVVAVRTPERKSALRKCAMDQARVEEAPATLIISAASGALEENADKVLSDWVALGYMNEKKAAGYRKFAGKHYGEAGSERRRIFAVKNAAFFAMSVMIAARGLGLETHPMDGFDEDAVKKEFGVDAGDTVICLVAVGWPKPGAKPLPRAWRRAPEEFARFV